MIKVSVAYLKGDFAIVGFRIASGMSGTLSLLMIFLGNIDHNAIGLSLTAYVEFSENDLIDNEFTGCTYGDSAYAWTYLHFHEPISRMTCDQSGYHIQVILSHFEDS